MAFMLGCEKVRVDFPTKTVFESVSLGVDEGDRIGIVGRNGDGKSTLLSVMAGMLEPDEGRVLRNGAVNKSTLHIDKPGRHTLRIRVGDPGIVLQKIVLDFGGMKRSYLGPQSTLIE